MTAADIPTPLESAGYTRISSSAEVEDFLARLAASAPRARHEIWGFSASGRPLSALYCAALGEPALTLLLVGSHHGGSEPAGGEALLVLARSLLLGALTPLRDRYTVIIVPNANPDGRDQGSNRNDAGVNLNRDYAWLSQPESRAMNAGMLRYRPDIVLDAHESAALKRRTLARAGYLTTFEAQLDYANNPAIAPSVQALAENSVLAPWCARVAARGLQAQRYIREVHALDQPLTHGGTSIDNFRNKAGLLGSLAFLLETRLDPTDGHYPSYRNIAARVAKQYLCMCSFLEIIDAQGEVLAMQRRTRTAPLPDTAVALDASYVPAAPPRTSVWLERIEDGARVAVEFPDHRCLAAHPPMRLPRAYLLGTPTVALVDALAEHGLVSRRLGQGHCLVAAEPLTNAARQLPTVPQDVLEIPLTQRDGVLAALLLEPASASRLVGRPAPHASLADHADTAIWRLR